jgi:Zn-dependent protease
MRGAVATTFVNGDFARAIPVVSSLFTVKDFQRNAKEEYVQFLIAESDVRGKFPALTAELGKIGMVATATRSEYVRWLMPTLKSVRMFVGNGVVVTVYKMLPRKAKSRYRGLIPLALFLATLTVVFVDGLLRADSAFAQNVIRDPTMLAIVYTMSLMGILGIHEMGHMIAAKHYGIRISWPYFVPTYPGFFYPTLGAMIRLQSNMPSRNAMFDVGISGPIAGLIVTVIVSIYGASISALIPVEEAEELFGNMQLIELNPSLLMMATMQLTGAAAEDAVLVMSPVMFAAWLGFLLTFLNLIPAAQLDGGHIARATLGSTYHRMLTFAGVGVLFVLLHPVMGILVLLMAWRAPESVPLDDVTPVSQKRKALFFVALGLAVVCAPIPMYLFSLF